MFKFLEEIEELKIRVEKLEYDKEFKALSELSADEIEKRFKYCKYIELKPYQKDVVRNLANGYEWNWWGYCFISKTPIYHKDFVGEIFDRYRKLQAELQKEGE